MRLRRRCQPIYLVLLHGRSTSQRTSLLRRRKSAAGFATSQSSSPRSDIRPWPGLGVGFGFSFATRPSLGLRPGFGPSRKNSEIIQWPGANPEFVWFGPHRDLGILNPFPVFREIIQGPGCRSEFFLNSFGIAGIAGIGDKPPGDSLTNRVGPQSDLNSQNAVTRAFKKRRPTALHDLSEPPQKRRTSGASPSSASPQQTP